MRGLLVEATALNYYGWRFNYIFYDVYSPAIRNIDPFDALSDDDIKTAIRNASSFGPNLFVPEVAFELLSK